MGFVGMADALKFFHVFRMLYVFALSEAWRPCGRASSPEEACNPVPFDKNVYNYI